MRWTFLDCCLLVLVLLSTLVMIESVAISGPPCSNHCADIFYYQQSTANATLHRVWEVKDCRTCPCQLCLCATLPFPPTCALDTTMGNQLAPATNSGLVCALNPLGYAEAQNPVGVGNFTPTTRYKCQ
jgi:hypothetical protein